MDEIEQTSQDINTVAEHIRSEGTTPKTPGDDQHSLVPACREGPEVKGGLVMASTQLDLRNVPSVPNLRAETGAKAGGFLPEFTPTQRGRSPLEWFLRWSIVVLLTLRVKTCSTFRVIYQKVAPIVDQNTAETFHKAFCTKEIR